MKIFMASNVRKSKMDFKQVSELEHPARESPNGAFEAAQR